MARCNILTASLNTTGTAILSNLVTSPLIWHAGIPEDGTKITDNKQRHAQWRSWMLGSSYRGLRIDPLNINGLFMVGTFLNGSYSSRDKISSVQFYYLLQLFTLPCNHLFVLWLGSLFHNRWLWQQQSDVLQPLEWDGTDSVPGLSGPACLCTLFCASTADNPWMPGGV